MKYVALLVGYNQPDYDWESATEEERLAEMECHGAFAAAVEAREGCRVVGGEALTGGDSATVLRRVDGDVTLTDGPFSEATEAIGGLYVLEAPNLDVAVQLFAVLEPYVLEIRPTDTSVEG